VGVRREATALTVAVAVISGFLCRYWMLYVGIADHRFEVDQFEGLYCAANLDLLSQSPALPGKDN